MAARMSLARKLALGSLGTAVVGGAGGYVMYKQRLKDNKAMTATDFNAAQDQVKVKAALSWVQKVAREPLTASAGPGIEMFRYTTCPFCGKAKAFLDYHGIPHETIEVEPMFKSQLAPSAYKKLPQLRFGGDGGVWLVDSDFIVEALAEHVGVGAQLQDPNVQKWRSWARESLVRHVTLNINKTLLGAWQGYSYIDAFDTIPFVNKLFLKVAGAPVMYMVATKKTYPTLVKAGELKDGDDWRTVFHDKVDYFLTGAGINETKPFHGGAKPDLADLDVYGVFQSVRGHAIYDDMLRNTKIGGWMERMDFLTGKLDKKLST